MIRLAVRVARVDADLALAGLLDLVPAGLEEVELPDGTVEYAVYRPADAYPAPADVRAALGARLLDLSTTTVADDWAERWREFHRPTEVGRRLWVRAPWEAPGRAGLIDIEIEPAQAFGTGSHPTTRLCLELLLSLAAADQAGPLLDIGCGSGVLAIAAARLGFAPVLGIDHEAQSVAATRANAAANGVVVEARLLDILADPLPTAPTVTANLLAPLLIDLAAAMTRPPRTLIAGGLAPDQADAVAAAFAHHHGFDEHERRRHGDWVALHLARPARAAPVAPPRAGWPTLES
ncbi:MAG: ribosomal protein methyltransferase [Solirubrobacteraceae bacterium]|nr:ribosomal protein methyltransferase [Solirubrobacteraceae bacterium]